MIETIGRPHKPKVNFAFKIFLVCHGIKEILVWEGTYDSQLKFSKRHHGKCGHLDFTPFQLIVTKLRLDEIIVWCHVCAMNVSIHYCYWKQGTWPRWWQWDKGVQLSLVNMKPDVILLNGSVMFSGESLKSDVRAKLILVLLRDKIIFVTLFWLLNLKTTAPQQVIF